MWVDSLIQKVNCDRYLLYTKSIFLGPDTLINLIGKLHNLVPPKNKINRPRPRDGNYRVITVILSG